MWSQGEAMQVLEVQYPWNASHMKENETEIKCVNLQAQSLTGFLSTYLATSIPRENGPNKQF